MTTCMCTIRSDSGPFVYWSMMGVWHLSVHRSISPLAMRDDADTVCIYSYLLNTFGTLYVYSVQDIHE